MGRAVLLPIIVLSLTQYNQHIYHSNPINTSLDDYINLIVAKICKKIKGNKDICVLTVGNSERKSRDSSHGTAPINGCHDIDG
jgi:hypothetical protein